YSVACVCEGYLTHWPDRVGFSAGGTADGIASLRFDPGAPAPITEGRTSFVMGGGGIWISDDRVWLFQVVLVFFPDAFCLRGRGQYQRGRTPHFGAVADAR